MSLQKSQVMDPVFRAGHHGSVKRIEMLAAVPSGAKAAVEDLTRLSLPHSPAASFQALAMVWAPPPMILAEEAS